MHLEMKPRCQKCTAPLPADGEAYICSFECTFCPACAANLRNVCPNCGGELVVRPRRRVSAGAEASGGSRAGPSWNRPGLIWAISFGVWTVVSLAATVTIEMYELVNHRPQLATVAGMEFSQILTYAPLTPFAYALAVRYPVQGSNSARRALLHLVGGLVFTVGHVALKAATPYGYWDPAHREWGFALWDSHLHSFGAPWFALRSMLLSSVVDDIVGAYVPIVLIAHVTSYYKRFRQKELRATQLEGQLAKAHLQTLKSQLQPHFLFNTLHSISALMLTDVTAADRMMTALSDLLRMGLESDAVQVTTLARELEFLGVYLDIEKTRFQDRLRVVFDIAPECLDAQVPHLLLQPLVENAVRHGISRRSGPGEIRVVAKQEGRNLELFIRDDGPGLVEAHEERSTHGLGLSVTRERLRTLYGQQQTCEIRNVAEGGAEVHLQIPFSAAPDGSRLQLFAADVGGKEEPA